MTNADELKMGCREMASGGGRPLWDSWGQGVLLQLSSSEPGLSMLREDSAFSRPVLLGQRLWQEMHPQEIRNN